MNLRRFRFRCALPCLILAAASVLVKVPGLMAAEPKPAAKNSKTQLARDMVGVWTRNAVPRGWAANAEGTEYKFIADKHWVVTHHDESGYTVYAHGGTHELDGDKSTGKIEFSTLYNAGMIGQAHTSKIDIEGDEFFQVGIGHDYTEKWTRLDDGPDIPLARDLIGVWKREATSEDDPSTAITLKYRFYGGKHWIELDTTKSGLALTAYGGTFELDGDKYTEKVTFSTQFDAHPIGELTKSTVVVRGDTLLQSDLDGQRTEKWTRAK